MSDNTSKPKGFTLIELLTVIAIIIMLASLVMPVHGNLQAETALNDTKDQVIQLLRTARNYSCTGKYNLAHGVYFDIGNNGNDRVVVFSGDTYGARREELDEIFEVEKSVAISDSFDDDTVVFAKNTCTPGQAGSISIRSRTVRNSHDISMNELGTVSEQAN